MDLFLEASQEFGYKKNEDFNDGDNEGMGYFPMTIDKGYRCSAAVAFLNPIKKSNILNFKKIESERSKKFHKFVLELSKNAKLIPALIFKKIDHKNRKNIDDVFCLTYGDGLGDVNINELVDYHQKTKKLATVTAIQTHGRFGSLDFDSNGFVHEFQEKPKNLNWVNGGFFVLEPEVFEYIENDTDCIWEKKPLEKLVLDGQLTAFQHDGFWHPMDTLRDKLELEDFWNSPNCAWKVWG